MRFRPLLARSTVAKTRETQSAELLTRYLVELDRRGWDLDEFTRQHPEVSEAFRHLLRVAERVRRVSAPVPSEAFRQRTRRHLDAAMARQPARSRWYRLGVAWRPYRPLIAPVAAGLLIVLGLGGVWSASATALPNSPLYPAKLAIERAELITAISPDRRAEVHLAIARERLREAAVEQEQGDVTAAQELIEGSDAEVAQAQAVVTASSPATAVATEVASSVAQVKDERRQIATRVVAMPVATPAPKALGGSDHPADRSAVGSPTPRGSGQARTDSANQPSGPGGDENRDDNPDNHQTAGKGNSHDSQNGRPSGNGGDNGSGRGDDGTVVARDAVETRTSSRDAPTPASGPDSDAARTPNQQADQLMHTLVTRALQGDPASQQTAAQYVAILRSQRSDSPGWRATLTSHRALIQKTIPAAPPSTRPVLQAVLQELNRAIGPPDSGQEPRDEASRNAKATMDSTWALAFSFPGDPPASATHSPTIGQTQAPGTTAFTPSSESRSALARLQAHATAHQPKADHDKSKGSDKATKP